MPLITTFPLRVVTVNRIGWAIEPHVLPTHSIEMLRRRAAIERTLYLKEMYL